MNELIEMLFGLLTWVDTRNNDMYSMGVEVFHGKAFVRGVLPIDKH